MNNLIGRKREIDMLKQAFESKQSEFVIVYGRRRVGKTFLVNSYFQNTFTFSYVGGHRLTTKQQLERFASELRNYGKSTFKIELHSWFDAFDALRQYLESLDRDERKVIFIDEMPWIDNAKSDFVKALEYFWNGWAMLRNDILLIASGSASSWMNDNLIENKGGLHGRINAQIYVEPFSLSETEQYLSSRGFVWDRYQIVQCYMIFGGIPFYLSVLNPSASLSQNVDYLFYAKNGLLKNEFDELYSTLFKNSETYKLIVKALFSKKKGLTRQQLIKETGLQGCTLTTCLKNLIKSDFVCNFNQFGMKSNNSIYKLCDFYTLFFLRFVENNNSKDTEWWSHNINSASILSWQGLSFELVCLSHLQQIKKALGISGISTESTTWNSPKSQIDIVIERADRIINLCEIKFSITPFEITADYEESLRARMSDFLSSTKTKKGIVNTFITTYGVKRGIHSSLVQSEITMDDLFA